MKLVQLSLQTANDRRKFGLIGADGNYRYCMECVVGSDNSLICCDSCPRTFHRSCLVPAARRRAAHSGSDMFRCQICEHMPFRSLG
eukprot:scaffold80336_cov43-Tisochrysis_lutea.AAC.1